MRNALLFSILHKKKCEFRLRYAHGRHQICASAYMRGFDLKYLYFAHGAGSSARSIMQLYQIVIVIRQASRFFLADAGLLLSNGVSRQEWNGMREQTSWAH